MNYRFLILMSVILRTVLVPALTSIHVPFFFPPKHRTEIKSSSFQSLTRRTIRVACVSCRVSGIRAGGVGGVACLCRYDYKSRRTRNASAMRLFGLRTRDVKWKSRWPSPPPPPSPGHKGRSRNDRTRGKYFLKVLWRSRCSGRASGYFMLNGTPQVFRTFHNKYFKYFWNTIFFC